MRSALGAGWVATSRVSCSPKTPSSGSPAEWPAWPSPISACRYCCRSARDDLPYIMTVTIDPTVLLAALAISALATFVFAFIPVLRFARPQTRLAEALHGGARAIAQGHEGNSARHMLLVAQVALALVLLVGCGLMIRTFVTLRQVDPGFQDPASVQTFQLTIPDGQHGATPGPGPGAIIRMQHAIADRLASVPGVAIGGVLERERRTPAGWRRPDGSDHRRRQDRRRQPCPVRRRSKFVSPRFFETMHDASRRRSHVRVGRRLSAASRRAGVGQLRTRRVGLGRVPRSASGSASGEAGPWLEVVGVVEGRASQRPERARAGDGHLAADRQERQPRSWSGANAPGRRAFWTSCGRPCGR